MHILRQTLVTPKSVVRYYKQPKDKKPIFQSKVNVKHHYPFLRDQPFDAKPFSGKYREEHDAYKLINQGESSKIISLSKKQRAGPLSKSDLSFINNADVKVDSNNISTNLISNTKSKCDINDTHLEKIRQEALGYSAMQETVNTFQIKKNSSLNPQNNIYNDELQ